LARWIHLAAASTKTNEGRDIPISARLRAILEMCKTGPHGKDHDEDAYVFGNEVGEPIGRVYKAWTLTCQRAGIDNLNFHDLRREFASRIQDSGAELHYVKDLLGHANITTTSRYLRSTPKRLTRAVERLESVIRTPFAHAQQTDRAAHDGSHTKQASNDAV